MSVGIPTDDDPDDRPVVAGWQVRLSAFFDRQGWHAPLAMDAYDFSDDWQHALVHEAFEPARPTGCDGHPVGRAALPIQADAPRRPAVGKRIQLNVSNAAERERLRDARPSKASLWTFNPPL
ncbi:MAG: hypothetical protein ACM36C_17450 [Acidobacteriota bacterium]